MHGTAVNCLHDISPKSKPMAKPHHDFLIIGAGIFGLSAAVELRKRKYSVSLLNPGRIPHPLAASTDISKVVRMEYGSDRQYFDMAEESIAGWHEWNALFGEKLYHETGFLLLCREPMEQGRQSFERESFRLLQEKNYRPQRLDAALIQKHFPGVGEGQYVDGFYNPKAGFVESGRVVERLTAYARQLGVDVFEEKTAARLVESAGRITGVETREGDTFSAGQVVVCAGAYSPLLVPDLQAVMRATGHPVFHLKSSRPELFVAPQLPVFAADISNSGWYGFPLHPKEKVLKIGNHGPGIPLHPEQDERIISETDIARLRRFLRDTFPSLADDPIVYTRRCLYCDTFDGHFWIDRHPRLGGLTVGTGGSGHGLKMAPVLGRLIANAAEGKDEPWLARFRWREVTGNAGIEEQARMVTEH